MKSLLETFEVLSPNQCDFLSGRRTQSLLKYVSDELHLAFERNQTACALFVDVAKAFDAVSHNILLKKKIEQCWFSRLIPFFASERFALAFTNCFYRK